MVSVCLVLVIIAGWFLLFEYLGMLAVPARKCGCEMIGHFI